MKRQLLLAAWIVLGSYGSLVADTVTINFEDLLFEETNTNAYAMGGRYYNGSDSAGGFTSQGASFNTSYDTLFESWGGWAYSNTTDVLNAGFTNQYSAYASTGGGGNSPAYGIAYDEPYTPTVPTITLPDGYRPASMQVTNTSYTAFTMLIGDNFSRRFGHSRDGDDFIDTQEEDWFKLTINGFNGVALVDSFDFYLADYRFEENDDDYLVSEWTPIVFPESFAAVNKLTFALSSSDVGSFGINTPTYFAMDNLILQAVPEPTTASLLLMAMGVLRYRRRSMAAVSLSRRQ